MSAMATGNKNKKRGGKRIDMRQIALDYSKRLTNDMRPLLWVVTIGGLLLGFYAVHERFEGALPWISAMVGLPWTAWGTAAAFYMSLAKSDHRKGGITYETAMAEILGAEGEPEDYGNMI